MDRAHEEWKLLQYAQLMKGSKLTIKEACEAIGVFQ